MNLPVQYTPGSGLNSFADKADQFLRGEDTPSISWTVYHFHQHPRTRGEGLGDNASRRRSSRSKTADRRYASGTPLSPVDGMPIGIKDVIQTRDMPTKFGSPIFEIMRPGLTRHQLMHCGVPAHSLLENL